MYLPTNTEKRILKRLDGGDTERYSRYDKVCLKNLYDRGLVTEIQKYYGVYEISPLGKKYLEMIRR